MNQLLELNNIYLGDNIELLKQLEPDSIHSCVSDFPYNLGFMGKKWDTISNYYQWCNDRAKELYRVLKPGAYCLIFGGTRTHHRMVCAFEDAGFEIKDEIQWIYGQGFPKSYNISKGFDKQAGAKREVVGKYHHPTAKNGMRTGDKNPYQAIGNMDGSYDITAPATELAKQWNGWGTALKPAQEPIMVAQKPIEKNYCYNIEKYGVGGLNIDDSRIPFDDDKEQFGKKNDTYDKNGGFGFYDGAKKQIRSVPPKQGRFPTNLILDKEAANQLDQQSGIKQSTRHMSYKRSGGGFIDGIPSQPEKDWFEQEIGEASRFFYCAKANTKDRTENGMIENKHPTVKPTDLIKYLIRLVTPPNGTCLDICEGSGTHAKACIQLSKEEYIVNYIGFENDKESFDTAKQRIEIDKNVKRK